MKRYLSVGLIALMISLTGCNSNNNNSSSSLSSNQLSSSLSNDSTSSTLASSTSSNENDSMSLLKNFDIKKAFGNTDDENFSFAMNLNGNLESSYVIDLVTLPANDEIFYSKVKAKLFVDDSLGLRKNEEATLGFDLFGKGVIGLNVGCIIPKSDSEEVQSEFKIGLKHDANWFYILNDKEEPIEQMETIEFKNYLTKKLNNKLMSNMIDTASIIPESLANGLNLNLAVEKLIDLGFSLQIDTSDGLYIHLNASTDLFTDLLNEFIEEILPDSILKYIPRIDLSYEANQFDITLAFDSNGIFKEYTIFSDVDLGFSFAIRNIFECSSHIVNGGSLSVTTSVN